MGPYLIERTVGGKYTLCDTKGRSIHKGEMFEERELVAYNHFE